MRSAVMEERIMLLPLLLDPNPWLDETGVLVLLSTVYTVVRMAIPRTLVISYILIKGPNGLTEALRAARDEAAAEATLDVTIRATSWKEASAYTDATQAMTLPNWRSLWYWRACLPLILAGMWTQRQLTTYAGNKKTSLNTTQLLKKST